jgi:hypothetical protein
MIETATFVCSICGEASSEICVHCTKDACRNHRCERCKRCSDCCECEIPLAPAEREVSPTRPEVLPAPPEASEEPDMNVPPAFALERTAALEGGDLEPLEPEPSASEPSVHSEPAD